MANLTENKIQNMYIPSLNGLKYPDDYLIKFFFKNGLHKRTGRVLEIGSSNGNNLTLFYEYGWHVTGVDISPEAITDANGNFTRIKKLHDLTNKFLFVNADMGEFAASYKGEAFDVILMPGSFYYTDIFNISKMLDYFSRKRMLNEDGLFFIRYRTPDDYRYGKGEKMGPSTFRFDFDETGEKGCINTFFTQQELENLMKMYYKLDHITQLKINFENIQNDTLITNADCVFWANAKKENYDLRYYATYLPAMAWLF